MDLIDFLEYFNRKERFFLLAEAFGYEGSQPRFLLSADFRQKVSDEVGLEAQGITIPEDAFVAFDYHLDWIHASLVLSHFTDEQSRLELLEARTDCYEAIKGNQEDIDLLVAFNTSGLWHLIFLEAKAYHPGGMCDRLTDFDENQLKSKAGRLKLILSPKGVPYPDIRPHFCLISGKKPEKCQPPWGNWIELTLPRQRLVVNRNAEVIKSGQNWKGKKKVARTVVTGKG